MQILRVFPYARTGSDSKARSPSSTTAKLSYWPLRGPMICTGPSIALPPDATGFPPKAAPSPREQPRRALPPENHLDFMLI
jgi:hypothetical protein